MAQSFARLGSEVFVIESAPGILPPRRPRRAAEIVQQRMARDGVKLLCCVKDLHVSNGGNGTVRLTVESEGEGYDLTVDKLLVAVGRATNVEGLNLEAAGVLYDKKGVKVDDQLRTANKRIYACGDICSPYQFTRCRLSGPHRHPECALLWPEKSSALTIPWATYTSPEIAHVGLYKGP